MENETPIKFREAMNIKKQMGIEFKEIHSFVSMLEKICIRGAENFNVPGFISATQIFDFYEKNKKAVLNSMPFTSKDVNSVYLSVVGGVCDNKNLIKNVKYDIIIDYLNRSTYLMADNISKYYDIDKDARPKTLKGFLSL